MASNSSPIKVFVCQSPYCVHRCSPNAGYNRATHTLCCTILPRRRDGANVVIPRPGEAFVHGVHTHPRDLVTFNCEICGRDICGLPGAPFMGGRCIKCGHVYCYRCSFQ